MNVILKFGTVAEANHKISGGVVGGAPAASTFENLVGQTITFSSPVGQCTFMQPAGTQRGQLRFPDVKSQMEAAIPGLKVLAFNNMVAFSGASSGVPVHLEVADEPARMILGFANNAKIYGLMLNSSTGSTPRFLKFVSECGSIYVTAELGVADVADLSALDHTLDFVLG